MGFVRDALTRSVSFVQEEILPLREDLMKAGIITPEKTAYEQKANLVDPWAYGSMAYGYKEKYSLLDYVKCRQITYADPIVASVIQTRINQAAAFSAAQPDKYKTGYKISLRDGEKVPTEADKTKIKEIEQFIANCGVPENFDDTPERSRRDSFDTFLRKVVRDSLSFDQVNFEIIPRMDGRPYAFQAVDAATIRRIPDAKESYDTGTSGSPTFADIMGGRAHSGEQFKEFKPKNPRYAQVINGIVRHVFDEWEMAFGVRNPRTDLMSFGYGYSEIEMLVTTITSHMNAETYNRKFFSQGSAIKGIITFEGAVPPDQLEGFRRQWYQQVTGVNNAWRTPIMALGAGNKLNWTSLHSNNREMEFGKWLEYCIKTICGVFQIDPLEIGFDISKQGSGQSGGSSGLGNSNQQERIRFSQDKGLRPLLTFIQSMINDYIVYRIDPNFQFEFVGLNVGTEDDELAKAEKKVKTFKTINEIRADNDLEPLPSVDKIKSPGDVVLDSSLIQFITSMQQQAAAPQGGVGPDGQPLPMGPDGQPMPGGEGQDPNQPEDLGEEEPDYENMSTEELEAELAKLDQSEGGGQAPAPKGKSKNLAQPKTMKSFKL